MRTLYLVRHAETAWNAAGRFQGQTDVPLNDAGRAQAAALRARISHRTELFDPAVAAVVSSDLVRAKESADIAFSTPGREILLDKGLRELRYGIFEGLLRTQISSDYAEIFRRFSDDPHYVVEGAEARQVGRDRALNVITEALLRLPPPHLIIMTHGGILRQLVRYAYQEAPLPKYLGFSNMCVHLIHVEEGHWVYAGGL